MQTVKILILKSFILEKKIKEKKSSTVIED